MYLSLIRKRILRNSIRQKTNLIFPQIVYMAMIDVCVILMLAKKNVSKRCIYELLKWFQRHLFSLYF